MNNNLYVYAKSSLGYLNTGKLVLNEACDYFVDVPEIVEYTSSDPEICRIEKDGTFEALKKGEVIMTVKFATGTETKRTIQVKEMLMGAYHLSDSAYGIRQGETREVTVYEDPVNITDKYTDTFTEQFIQVD